MNYKDENIHRYAVRGEKREREEIIVEITLFCWRSIHSKTKKGHKMMTEKEDLVYYYTKMFEL